MRKVIVIIVSLVIVESGFSIPCSALSTEKEDIRGSWGPIFYHKLTAYPENISKPNGSEIVPTMTYKVIGFGNHYISWEFTYYVLCTDGWHNGTYNGRDGLYIILRPILFIKYLKADIMPWKCIANGKFVLPLECSMIRGDWIAELSIDDAVTDIWIWWYP